MDLRVKLTGAGDYMALTTGSGNLNFSAKLRNSRVIRADAFSEKKLFSCSTGKLKHGDLGRGLAGIEDGVGFRFVPQYVTSLGMDIF